MKLAKAMSILSAAAMATASARIPSATMTAFLCPASRINTNRLSGRSASTVMNAAGEYRFSFMSMVGAIYPVTNECEGEGEEGGSGGLFLAVYASAQQLTQSVEITHELFR